MRSERLKVWKKVLKRSGSNEPEVQAHAHLKENEERSAVDESSSDVEAHAHLKAHLK